MSHVALYNAKHTLHCSFLASFLGNMNIPGGYRYCRVEVSGTDYIRMAVPLICMAVRLQILYIFPYVMPACIKLCTSYAPPCAPC